MNKRRHLFMTQLLDKRRPTQKRRVIDLEGKAVNAFD